MNEENVDQNVGQALDTQHEPHEHASRRVLVGVGATVLVFILGGLLWARWGDKIERACFGDKGACEVETQEDATFTIPSEYSF